MEPILGDPYIQGLRGKISELETQTTRQSQEISRLKKLLGVARKFLNDLEMGDQMFCLICNEGNDGEKPEHKEDCHLKLFLSLLSATEEKS